MSEQRVQSLLDFFCGRGVHSVFTHPGEPQPMLRPRIHNRAMYMPRRSKRHRESVAWAFKLIPRFAGHVTVVVVFKRALRFRTDVDNLLKLVMDSGKDAGTWGDDSQVRTVVGIIEEVGEGQAATIVGVGRCRYTDPILSSEDQDNG